MRRGRAQPWPWTACQTTHNVVPTSCKKKNNAQLNAQLYFLLKKNAQLNVQLFFFLLLSVGLRGEVDPRESLPLKSPFLPAHVFRYMVRLAFASVKHCVLVRVHLVKRGFTRSPRVSPLCRRPLDLGGCFYVFFHLVFCFILGRIFERFWTLSGASFSAIIWETTAPVQHEEGLRKWSRKKCGFEALQTLKTSSACRREHDSVVLLDSRKTLILDAFWNSILEPLGRSCAENTIF